CDPLALVDGFTPVEDNAGLLETRFNEESVCVFLFPEDVMGLVNLTLFPCSLGVIATNFSLELLMLGQKIYKPTNNNLKTSSNIRRAKQDNTLRINRGTRYDNQRVVNVVGARKNVGTQVVQQSGIQCYNCKEYGHVARECQKPKRTKGVAYHKEKMLFSKQEEAGFWLNAEQADWKDDTDDEPGDQELEAHYMYMAQIQEVIPDAADNSGPNFDAEPLQKVHNNDDNYNVFSIESEHPELPESVNDTYPVEQDEHNMIIY
nr:hypothetical protein [Tanacetum cinerariifolium]